MKKSNRKRPRLGPVMRIVRREIHEIDRIDHLGERIAWRLAELGITTYELAKRLGTKRQDIQRRVRLDPTMSIQFLGRLMIALEVDELAYWHKPLPIPQQEAKTAASSLLPKAR